MSSEEMERALDVLRALEAQYGSGDLLAEVARLERAAEHAEQQRAEYAKAWVDQQYRLQEAEAALAVAREREQRAVKTAERLRERWDLAHRAIRNGLEEEHYLADLRALEGRDLAADAALVDEPAAANDATAKKLVGYEPYMHYPPMVRPLEDRFEAPEATLAEPGKARSTRGRDADEAAGSRSAPGSASAAADEPGETPA